MKRRLKRKASPALRLTFRDAPQVIVTPDFLAEYRSMPGWIPAQQYGRTFRLEEREAGMVVHVDRLGNIRTIVTRVLRA